MAADEHFSDFAIQQFLAGDQLAGMATRAAGTDNARFLASVFFDSGAQVVNVCAYSASGSSATTTLASAAGASANSVQLADSSTFKERQGIRIAGAGPSGGLYVGAITSKGAGGVVNISPPTSTAVSSGAVAKHDDTAAIQSAIDYAHSVGGGLVFFPPGFYRCRLDTIKLHKFTQLVGSGMGSFGSYGVTALVFEETSGIGIQNLDTSDTNRIEGMQIFGPGLATVPSDANTIGLKINYGVRFILQNVLVCGWGIGASYYATGGYHQGAWIDQCYDDCLQMTDCQYWASRSSQYGNSSHGCSVHLTPGDIGCQYLEFDDGAIDECSGLASLQIDRGNDIMVRTPVIFTASNAFGSGGGFGVRLGNGTVTPTRVKLHGVKVRPYELDRPAASLNKTILIRGSGHSLIDVKTEIMAGYSGADIQDDSSDSRMFNVNDGAGIVHHKLRLLTSSSTINSGELYANSGVVTVKP
jgi:Pectate lyase superfamily protein